MEIDRFLEKDPISQKKKAQGEWKEGGRMGIDLNSLV